MRLESIELRRVDLAFRQPVGTAAGTHDRRPVVYVRVRAGGVEGWGECGALAAGTAVDPPLAEVWRTLATEAVPAVLRAARARGGEAPSAVVVPTLLDRSSAGRMAGAALEMAVLDAELQVAGISLAAHLVGADGPGGLGGPGGSGGLGGLGGPVPAGGVVGIPDDRLPGSVVAAVAAVVEQGCSRVRVKIEPGWDAVPLRAVRRAFPDLALQADANGAYRLGAEHNGRGAAGERSAERLVALDELGLACIEQPLPPGEPDDLAAHALLADLLATPICLDESLTSRRRVREAIDSGACEVACIKPARLGGVRATERSLEACRSAGVPAFLGGFFETGLGRSANVALATLPGCTLASDLSDPAGYLEGDPCPYRGPEGGKVPLPVGPGVALSPDPELLAARTAVVETFDCVP